MKFVPRLGPLRFLALFVASGVVLALSRVPAVTESVRVDLAALEAWQRAQDVAVAAEEVEASPRIFGLPVAALDPAFIASPPRHRVPLPEREGPGVGLSRTRHSDLVQVPLDDPPPVPGRGPSALAIPFELSPAKMEAAKPQTTAYTFATQAYAGLALGDRRAASGLKAAIAAAPSDPDAATWQAQLTQLNRKWSGEAFTLLRASGTPALGVAPLLGGGQSGARLTYTPDPLMRRPVALTARASIAHDARVDTASAQGAVGAQWRVLPTVAISAERLVALGDDARNGWTLRTEAGIARRIGPVALDAFAEAGVVGIHRRDLFASLQARAATPLGLTPKVSVEPGIGLWSAVQRSDTTASRIDIGPNLTLRAPHAALSLDYRRRIAGNASPGNGATLTLSAGF